jgi:hypothetical protein
MTSPPGPVCVALRPAASYAYVVVPCDGTSTDVVRPAASNTAVVV